jgi:nitric oxide reductase activation protein
MMQSQTDEPENINETTQTNQFEPAVDPVVEYQMYDLNACDLTVWVGEDAVYLTSDVKEETTATPHYAARRKTPARHRFKWTDNEIDQLYREVQLKNYTIQEISARHQRTNSAILFKLKEEKLIQWDCSLDNTNMRTVLQYYNEYLRNYQVIEEEDNGEEDEDEEEEDEEDYVPADGSEEEEDEDEEEEEDEDEEEVYININRDFKELINVTKYTPDTCDKLMVGFLTMHTIFCTVIFAIAVLVTSDVLSYGICAISRC